MIYLSAFLTLNLLRSTQTYCLGNYSFGEWKDMKNGDPFPDDAVKGGNDREVDLYICRTSGHSGKSSKLGICWVPYASKESASSKFQILTAVHGAWAPVFDKNDSLPCNIFKITERYGKDVFSGRKKHVHKGWESLTLGEVFDSVNTITYGGFAYSSEDNYEIFTAVPKEIDLKAGCKSKTYKTNGNYITFTVRREGDIRIFLGSNEDRFDFEILFSTDFLELVDVKLKKSESTSYDLYDISEYFGFTSNIIR